MHLKAHIVSSLQSSTRTTSTFSDRISSALSMPFTVPFLSKSRSLSKLHLSIPASTQSSPSSVSTATTSPPLTPLSPTFSFAVNSSPSLFPFSQSPGGYAGSVQIDPNASRISLHCMETEDEVLAIGRVLTPDLDPFAKPDIELEWDRDYTRDVTPRPMSDVPRKRNSGVRRKRGSGTSRSGISVAIPEDPLHVPVAVYPEELVFDSTATASPPPSPSSFRQQTHPPSAWFPRGSPQTGHSGLPYIDQSSVSTVSYGINTSKDLPPRPPSRPLPGIPSTDIDVFGNLEDSALTSTPRKPARLRRERRSINSILTGPHSSPSSSVHSSPSSPTKSLTRLSPRPKVEEEMVFPLLAKSRSIADRPPSPFPLVRELSEESRRLKRCLAEITAQDDSGAVLKNRRKELSVDTSCDNSRALSDDCLQDLAVGQSDHVKMSPGFRFASDSDGHVSYQVCATRTRSLKP